MASGGNHPPANPAQVSGPGALSRRTDQKQPVMPLTGGPYGSNAESVALQGGAPMSAPPSGAPTGAPEQANVAPPTPINAPSARPDEPVTAGAAMGAGPGLEALGLPQTGNSTKAQLRAQYGPLLNAYIVEAQSASASQEFKDAVRSLISLI